MLAVRTGGEFFAVLRRAKVFLVVCELTKGEKAKNSPPVRTNCIYRGMDGEGGKYE